MCQTLFNCYPTTLRAKSTSAANSSFSFETFYLSDHETKLKRDKTQVQHEKVAESLFFFGVITGRKKNFSHNVSMSPQLNPLYCRFFLPITTAVRSASPSAIQFKLVVKSITLTLIIKKFLITISMFWRVWKSFFRFFVFNFEYVKVFPAQLFYTGCGNPIVFFCSKHEWECMFRRIAWWKRESSFNKFNGKALLRSKRAVESLIQASLELKTKF